MELKYKCIIDSLFSEINHNKFKITSEPEHHKLTYGTGYAFEIQSLSINEEEGHHKGEYNVYEIGYDLESEEYYILYVNNGYDFDDVNENTISDIVKDLN